MPSSHAPDSTTLIALVLAITPAWVVMAIPPANNSCSAPTALAADGVPINGTTLEATNDGAASCDFGGAASRDVWYFVEAAAAGTLHVDVCSDTIDAVVSVHPLACGIDLACSDICFGYSRGATCLTVDTIGPQFFWIRVSDQGIGVGGPFVIQAALLPTSPPNSNDDCVGPTVIASSTTSFNPPLVDTTQAGGSCIEPQESCESGEVGVSNTVWFSFTPQRDGNISANTFGSDYDTVLTVFAGDCSSAAELACSDDTDQGLQSQVQSVPAVIGTSYLIKVSDYDLSPGGGTLDFGFSFSVGPACPADIAPPEVGDGQVNVDDLLGVINAWGNCPDPDNCPADIAPSGGGDNQVNVDDLLAIINGWGACP